MVEPTLQHRIKFKFCGVPVTMEINAYRKLSKEEILTLVSDYTSVMIKKHKKPRKNEVIVWQTLIGATE